MNNLAPMRKCSGVQGRLNCMPWYNLGHVVRFRFHNLYFRVKIRNNCIPL